MGEQVFPVHLARRAIACLNITSDALWPQAGQKNAAQMTA
jgi:hypothetical protein